MILSSILGVVSAAVGILDSNDDAKVIAGKMTDLVKQNKNLAINLMANGSMTKIIGDYIIEPTAIVSNDVKTDAVTEKILELDMNIFASFYMQVFDILTKINGMGVTSTINLLATSKSIPTEIIKVMSSNISASLADFDFAGNIFAYDKLPSITITGKDDMKTMINFSIESLGIENDGGLKLGSYVKQPKNDNEKTETGNIKVTENDVVKSIPSMLQRSLNLEISITNDNGYKQIISIPILIKMRIIYTDFSNISNAVEPHNTDTKFWARWIDWRAGGISLADLLFSGDLIKKYKKNKIKDKDELLSLINNRNTAANIKVATNGMVGFEKYYNMLIISKDNQDLLEKIIRGKISNEKYKELIMDATGSLLMTVLDMDYERAVLYIKDISGTSDVSYKALTKKSGKYDDLSDIFKALIGNRPPVI